MRDFVPDLALIDINMPGCSGPELARLIRFDDDWLRIPLVYLSAESDVQRQAQALAQAGDDFLVKPIADVALVAAVTARAQRSRQLSQALACDGLTGLIKHPAIKELIEIEQSRTQRSGAEACVVMIDIDRFKSINDTYGHGTGDYVIRLLANLLRQRLRRVDHIGRYGGKSSSRCYRRARWKTRARRSNAFARALPRWSAWRGRRCSMSPSAPASPARSIGRTPGRCWKPPIAPCTTPSRADAIRCGWRAPPAPRPV
nr:diguanylate cyclase [Salinicola acroporae]